MVWKQLCSTYVQILCNILLVRALVDLEKLSMYEITTKSQGNRFRNRKVKWYLGRKQLNLISVLLPRNLCEVEVNLKETPYGILFHMRSHERWLSTSCLTYGCPGHISSMTKELNFLIWTIRVAFLLLPLLTVEITCARGPLLHFMSWQSCFGKARFPFKNTLLILFIFSLCFLHCILCWGSAGNWIVHWILVILNLLPLSLASHFSSH